MVPRRRDPVGVDRRLVGDPVAFVPASLATSTGGSSSRSSAATMNNQVAARCQRLRTASWLILGCVQCLRVSTDQGRESGWRSARSPLLCRPTARVVLVRYATRSGSAASTRSTSSGPDTTICPGLPRVALELLRGRRGREEDRAAALGEALPSTCTLVTSCHLRRRPSKVPAPGVAVTAGNTPWAESSRPRPRHLVALLQLKRPLLLQPPRRGDCDDLLRTYTAAVACEGALDDLHGTSTPLAPATGRRR